MGKKKAKAIKRKRPNYKKLLIESTEMLVQYKFQMSAYNTADVIQAQINRNREAYDSN